MIPPSHPTPSSPSSTQARGEGEVSTAMANCGACEANKRMIDELFARLTHLELSMQQEASSTTSTSPYYARSSSLEGYYGEGSFATTEEEEEENSSVKLPRRGRQSLRPSTTESPQRTDLDEYLLPFLAESPHITTEQIPQILHAVLPHFPSVRADAMASLVREWFRKRREYMTHRVNAYCDKHFCMQTEEDVLPGLVKDRAKQDAILRAVRLDITANAEAAREYLVERITAYFGNRRKHDSRR